jgi:hypothetical protein
MVTASALIQLQLQAPKSQAWLVRRSEPQIDTPTSHDLAYNLVPRMAWQRHQSSKW